MISPTHRWEERGRERQLLVSSPSESPLQNPHGRVAASHLWVLGPG